MTLCSRLVQEASNPEKAVAKHNRGCRASCTVTTERGPDRRDTSIYPLPSRRRHRSYVSLWMIPATPIPSRTRPLLCGCDLPALGQQPHVASSESPVSPAFASCISNTVSGLNAAQGMVWIPEGGVRDGRRATGNGSCEMPMASNDVEPVHRAGVDGFLDGRDVVTNEQFANFLMRPATFPSQRARRRRRNFGAPAENLVAGAVVFTRRIMKSLHRSLSVVNLPERCDWRHPLGRESDIKGNEN